MPTDSRWWWQRSSLCKYYARLVAVLLVFLGVATPESTFGSSTWPSTALHLGLAGIYAYAGLFLRHKEDVQQVIQGMGWLLVGIALCTLLAFWAMGEATRWNPLGLACFALGITSILAGRSLRDPSPSQDQEAS